MANLNSISENQVKTLIENENPCKNEIDKNSIENEENLTNFYADVHQGIYERLGNLEYTVEKILSRRREKKAKSKRNKRKGVTETEVFEAVKSGNPEVGVSRAYIRKYLEKNCHYNDSKYGRQKLNSILKKSAESGKIVVDNSNQLITGNGAHF